MKVIFGLRRFKKVARPVVTLGVFDGLHRGHLKIISRAVRTARRIKGKSVVVTFYPHPQAQKSLYSLKHRIRLLREQGVDICVVIKFTGAFSRISAAEFVENILVEKIRPLYVYVGENFTFGRGGLGGAEALKRYSHTYAFKLKVFSPARSGARPISSTAIRSLIRGGDLTRAGRLLGRRVSVLGKVTSGSGIGRTLGFPTANITPHHEVLPPPGIYAARVSLNNKFFAGACYIGSKPTLKRRYRAAAPAVHIEVHIFDFRRNIYGKELEVEFIKKIREDRKFSSREALVKRISKDVFLAQKILHHNISVFQPR
jgi:riboflavin kinase/FMN adenylyltransferase